MARADHIITSRTRPRKGRGALSNRDSRFSPLTREYDEEHDCASRVTECRAVKARRIITRNQSPDVPFEQSINPYQGCEHGCVYCYARPTHAYILLRLPLEIRTLFEEWSQAHFPLRAERVMSLVRQSRGGAEYDTRFGHRMRGTGPFAELLQRRFEVCCRKLGLQVGETPPARTDLFNPPSGIGSAQQDLFA